jgi:hypothetical protein
MTRARFARIQQIKGAKLRHIGVQINNHFPETPCLEVQGFGLANEPLPHQRLFFPIVDVDAVIEALQHAAAGPLGQKAIEAAKTGLTTNKLPDPLRNIGRTAPKQRKTTTVGKRK